LKATNKFKATDKALTEAQARHPQWGIWISSARRYWATRQGNIRLTGHPHPGWAMTIDADSLPELETALKKQEGYERIGDDEIQGAVRDEGEGSGEPAG